MPPPSYLRDGRAPVPENDQVSRVMSRIRARDTGPERQLRQALRKAGLVGYRLHYGKVPGRPDIAFVGRKLAVFVHGCFWHGCPHCQLRRPRTHTRFWSMKLARNQERDARKERELHEGGWKVITVWECHLKHALDQQVRRVVKAWDAAGRKAVRRTASRTPRKRRTARTAPRRSAG